MSTGCQVVADLDRFEVVRGDGGSAVGGSGGEGGTGGSLPTCDDGEQNGEETAVDCGGTVCAACSTCADGGPVGVAFVDVGATGTNTGATWGNAYTDLQNALAYVAGCDEVDAIWVAAGVYLPGADPRQSFHLHDGVSLFGGFAGTEAMLDERNIADNPTILSGDVDGDDIKSAGVILRAEDIRGVNAHHVVRVADVQTVATLDGFTITGGSAMENVVADTRGAALFVRESSVAFAHLTLIGNASREEGGAAWIDGGTTSLDEVTMTGNVAERGGGLFIRGGELAATRLAVVGNHASSGGGGIYLDGSNAMLERSRMVANESGRDGGGMLVAGGRVTLEGVLLEGNRAQRYGGAIEAFDGELSIVNTTVDGNYAAVAAGALRHAGAMTTTIANAIIWNNLDGDNTNPVLASSIVRVEGSRAADISFSLVAHTGGSDAWVAAAGTDGGDNADEDPLFVSVVNPATAPTESGNARLMPLSPAIDAGSNALVNASVDLDDNPRINGAAVDLGSFESN